jgi:hypothetical protein
MEASPIDQTSGRLDSLIHFHCRCAAVICPNAIDVLEC